MMLGRLLSRLLAAAPRPDPVQTLAEAYRLEARLARQLDEHAGRLPRYPWLQAALRVLAGEARAAADRLAAALAARGAALPPVPEPGPARSDWERLRGDVDDLRAAAEWYASAAYDLQRDHGETAALLLELRRARLAGADRLAWLLGHLERAALERTDAVPAAALTAPAPPPTPVTGRLDIDGFAAPA